MVIRGSRWTNGRTRSNRCSRWWPPIRRTACSMLPGRPFTRRWTANLRGSRRAARAKSRQRATDEARVPMKTALLLCVIAAVGYGVGAVLQAVGARHAAAKGCSGSDGLVTMVIQPIFLLGLLVDFASWLISRFALHTLPLFAVQTILAGSLAVTVLLARV